MFVKFLFLLFLFTTFPLISHAYLEPGTGTIILQAIVGFAAGIVVFYNNLKLKISMILKKIFKKKTKI